MTDYNAQAAEFLRKTGATIKVEYLRQGKYFDDDKEERDIYNVTLSRGDRSFTFTFGQSTAHSGRFIAYDNQARGMAPGTEIPDRPGEYRKPADDYPMQRKWGRNKDYEAPGAYSILACMTKYDPGTLENFCDDFGYDTDSRKAEKIYEGVKNEYTQLCTLFNDAELRQMQEIQ